MTSFGAGMMSRPGGPARRATLTAEEKLARDAQCRRERRDLDDDEVKAWISGKHLIIERNKGEDVEIVDANPSSNARDDARKNPDLNVKEVTAPDVKRAKETAAGSRDGDSTPTTGSSTPARDAPPPKRFDLRSMPGRESFRKMFGGSEASTSRSPDASRQAQRIASPVQEEEEDPESGRLRFADTPADRHSGAAPVKKTGIAMDRTETTDSQIRFGDLPVPVRRKKK
jgi:hypothetical protein